MDEDVVMLTSLGIGLLLGIWTTAWMFHIGPDGNQQTIVWWAFPYWITSIASGVAVFLVSGFFGSCIYHRRLSMGKTA